MNLRAPHLFFDLDGTLCNSSEGIVHCLETALKALGRPCPDMVTLESFIGPPLRQTFQTLLDTTDASTIERAVDAYRTRFRTTGFLGNRLYPGVLDALIALTTAGRVLYVVSAKPQPFAEQVVEQFALGAYFRFVQGGRLDGERSDKTTLIGEALARGGLDARDVVMIGDREHDVLGARANGVASIAAAWGYGRRAEIDAAAPDAVTTSLSELLELLGVEVAPGVR